MSQIRNQKGLLSSADFGSSYAPMTAQCAWVDRPLRRALLKMRLRRLNLDIEVRAGLARLLDPP